MTSKLKSKSVKKKPAAAKVIVKAVMKPATKEAKPVIKKTVSAALSATKPAKKSLGNYFYANGKRKTSVASVRLFTNGAGTIVINGRTFENYFPVLIDQDKILSPLRIANALKAFNISVKIHGGGIHSQAEAVRHGIAKALLGYKAELRGALKHAGFLTRDARIKERKKAGLKRARRAPQWAKR